MLEIFFKYFFRFVVIFRNTLRADSSLDSFLVEVDNTAATEWVLGAISKQDFVFHTVKHIYLVGSEGGGIYLI